MTRDDACILSDLLEAATGESWPRVREKMEGEFGWLPSQIVRAAEALAELAHRSPIIEQGDF